VRLLINFSIINYLFDISLYFKSSMVEYNWFERVK